jgi:hypothetical protein
MQTLLPSVIGIVVDSWTDCSESIVSFVSSNVEIFSTLQATTRLGYHEQLFVVLL